MSAQHTEGSIRYDYEPGYCGELIAHDGTTVAAFVDEPSEANARRLVACWNYCEGLDTEGMERAVEMKRPIKVFIDESIKKELELLAQRDVLLEALREVAAWDKIGAFPRVHAAIATAKGGA